MSLISFEFFLFLAVGCLGFYLLPKRFQWVCLLFLSYWFYLSGGWKTVGFMILTTFTTWGGARLIGLQDEKVALRIKNADPPADKALKKVWKSTAKRKKKQIFLLTLLLNFGVLFFLKYTGFLFENINVLAAHFSSDFSLPQLTGIILPLGISFYTFQAIGYLIDVYNAKYKPQQHFGKFALFISFFPQIIQGPIGRYDQLAPQFEAEKSFNFVNIKHGAILMLWGLFKKMVIADRMAPLVNTVFASPNAYGGSVIVLGVLFYAFQLYTDFSGGIDIITGAAQLFGIQMAPNFKRPYFAVSLGDFWRRWHISLGSWMRDYVFYPLATSKGMQRISKSLKKGSPHLSKTFPAVFGNIVVFLLVGVWHGAQWSFILWGLYNGLVLAFSALLEPVYKSLNSRIPKLRSTKIWYVFTVLRTFFVVCIGYYFDRCNQISDAFLMLKRTVAQPWISQLTNGTLLQLGLTSQDFVILAAAMILLFTVSVAQERGIPVRQWLDQRCVVVRWALLYALIFFFIGCAVTGTAGSEGFMYAIF